MKKHIIFSALFCAMIFIFCGSVSATNLNTTPLPNYSDIYVNVSNDEGISFNTTGNGTYYIQQLDAPNGGFNAVHIANDSSYTLNYGGSTITTNQSGTFYATDTGGRGYQDDVVLMLAVNGTIPDNFALHITVHGYNWTPYGYNNCPEVSEINPWGVTLDETFTKSDFIYGLQNWKPTGGNANYPIFIGENMSDPDNMFYLMFIDLHAGLLGSNYKHGSNSQFINNGAVQIDYSFENLLSSAAFNIYAWNWNTTQGQGMLWTNSILPGQTGGPSGYVVKGTSGPAAAFTVNPTNPVVNQVVQFTDHSTGITPITYLWNFGDGTTSTLQNPTHVYNSNGTYQVTLTITNSIGSNQITQNITVSKLLVSANVPSGLYNTSLSVNLTSTDTAAEIYYTLDGSNPTTDSTRYTGPISITNEGVTTLKYIAVDGNSSANNTNVYTIDKTAPIVTDSPEGGTYNVAQNVTLTTTDYSNTTTYYTIDNTDPISSNTRIKYSSPIAIHTNTTLKYAALDAAGNWSPVYTQNYTMVSITPPTVSANMPGGSYTTNLNVYLSAVDVLDPNPKIYYTDDGTDPTVNSTLYTWPKSIDTVGTTVLKFIAVNYAGLVSNVVTNIYTLDKPPVSGTWNSTQIDTTSIKYNSIVMDASGYPHIAYSQDAVSGSNPQLKYAYKDKNGWHIETVETSQSGSGYYVSLALDSAGNPHLAYEDNFGGAVPYSLRYAYRDSTGWHITILTSNYTGNIRGDTILGINLVLYQDQPRISFFNGTGNQIEYMYKNGTNWVTEIAAINGGVSNSLALDSAGNPKISYYSVSPQSLYGSLRYTERTANGTWKTTIIDNSAPYVGSSNSLALDSEGNPYIVYIWDNSSETGVDMALKYAYWNGTEWVIENSTISNLETGVCKLVMDQSNSPLVIYQDVASGHLEYAYKEGSSWHPITIDTVNGSSIQISLALNLSGVPNVSYGTLNYNLRYAYITPFNVNASLAGGTYNLTQTVSLTATPGTTIYYTTDGSDPRTSSKKVKYTSPIAINNTTTLKFAAVDSANNWSTIYTETYVIIKPVTNNRTGVIYNTIQDAINDQNTTNGDTLTVNPGTFIENITLNKRLILNALGAIVNPLNTALPVFTITSAGNGSILQGFIVSGASASSGVSISGTNVTILNCTINGNNIGILLIGSQNNITGNNITGNGWAGICADTVSQNKIINNTVSGNPEGIYLLNTTSNTVTGNKIINNTVNGLNIQGGSQNNIQNNTITGNGVSTNGSGLILKNSTQNTLENNTVQGNGWSGIVLDGSSNNIIGNSSHGNTVSDNGNGLVLYNLSSHNTVTSNTIQNNLYNGLQLYIGCDFNQITANNIIGNKITGLIVQNSNNNTLTNNTAQNNSYNGVVLAGSSQNTLTGNNISQNGNTVDWGGIGLLIGQNSNNNLISNNQLIGNVWTNIVLDGSIQNNLTQNTINGNHISQQGIMLVSSSNNTQINNNTISNNTANGLNIQNSNNNTITNNAIAGNGNNGAGIGLLLSSSNSNTINHNTFQNSGWAGTCIVTSTGNTIMQNNYINNPEQAYDNGTNSYDNGTTGNYYNNWSTTNSRPVDGGSNVDHHPSLTQF